MKLISVETDNIEVIFNRMYQPTRCMTGGTGNTATTSITITFYHLVIYILSSTPTEFKYESPMPTNEHKYYCKLSLFKIGNKEENYYKGAHIIWPFMLRYIFVHIYHSLKMNASRSANLIVNSTGGLTHSMLSQFHRHHYYYYYPKSFSCISF